MNEKKSSLKSFLKKNAISALVLCAGMLSPYAMAARLAFVVGNDGYQNVPKLSNAKNDAKLIQNVLGKAGFNVVVVTDANREKFWNAFDNFKGRIQKGDEVVFYFAGHGVQIGTNQVLLPTDINAKDENQVQRDGIPLLSIQEGLQDARLAVLFIDACRDNPFPKQGTRSIGGLRGLVLPESTTGQVIMMSAGRNQKALDSVPGEKNANNGLFTWELVQAIQKPGVEIRQALELVKDNVDDRAKKVNHDQRPSVLHDIRGQFFFITASAGSNTNLEVTIPDSAAMPKPIAEVDLTVLKQQEAVRQEKEKTTKKEWMQWQQRMKLDFNKTLAFKGSPDLQAKAWEMFLSAWEQNNPFSQEDDNLRTQAKNRLSQVQILLKKTTLAIAPPAPSVVEQPVIKTPQPKNTALGLVDNGDETITDPSTNLMWKKNPESGKYVFEDANNMFKQVTFGQYSDWRMPTYDELVTLLRKAKNTGVKIDEEAFPHSEGWFWTSSSYSRRYPPTAWGIDFDNGRASDDSTNSLYRVRLVRNKN